MDYTRQSELVNQNKISSTPISLIGCGAIGSTVAMALAKMGVQYFTLFDEDGVNEVNLPNQMYRIGDIGDFKVDALGAIIKSYNPDAVITAENRQYIDQPLKEVVIVTTDSMYSRKYIWGQFCKQEIPQKLIEARMGAEEGQVYTIVKRGWAGGPNTQDASFYQERLYSDEQANPAPCTAKAIIYNVFMIASLVCRAFKAVIHEEPFPREVIMGMSQIHRYSFQIRN